MNKYKFLLYCLVAAALVWSVGCDEDDPEPEPVLTGLEILEVPQTLLANIDSIYTFRIRISDEGVEPEYVHCWVYPPDDSHPSFFRLYDDGSVMELDTPAYAGTSSGDIVPNNGTYTRTINSRLMTGGLAGAYRFDFSAADTDPFYFDSISIEAANIEDCIIANAPTLSGMEDCFTAFEIGVSLTKTDPDEIDSVWLLVDDDNRVLLTQSEVDTYWTTSIAPMTFPCLSTGDHTLSYEAVTRFGLSCELEKGTIQFVNDSQQITKRLGLPEYFERPTMEGDTDTVFVTLKLEDCNLSGIQTYNGVRFEVKRDDGGFFYDDSFVFSDAGLSGDTVAGDDVYTVGMTFARSDLYPDNIYIFRYFSVECAPPFERSDYLYDTVHVTQPQSISTTSLPTGNGFGLNTLYTPEQGVSR